MSQFMNSMKTDDTLTENGAVTHSTSGKLVVDLFATIGAMRGKDAQAVTLFNKAAGEDTELAIRAALWARDVREGAGERSTFRAIFKQIIEDDLELGLRVMAKIPELGRYDDLLVAFGTPLQEQAIDMWLNAIFVEKNQLAAKWCPRERSANGYAFKAMRKRGDVSNKVFRKAIAALSDTVEQKMCAKLWSEIDFGKLPSVASARYQKSFGRNAPTEYGNYINALSKGEAKINAGAIYPYTIVQSVRAGNATVADAQWKALPNYMEGCQELIMPVVDVSGSMGTGIGGANANSVSCKDVAKSLGLYIAERNEGEFKNEYISFSTDPHFHTVSGKTLKNRLDGIERSGEDMGTDLLKVFEVLLCRAKRTGLADEHMPDKVLIMSDMQFNQSFGWRNRNVNSLDAMKRAYENAGYTMPHVVYWNIAARPDQSPAKANDKGVSLVSGCSPTILRNILGDTVTPYELMMETLSNDRYNF